ncbi:hypothetical protein DL95DRAFT_392870 [Leptodontidium sp. 2 PMI_412]|nr:hypothetical protein DL95DRAFT_392870 [Leptodontidium sp. 2 PMI_412]
MEFSNFGMLAGLIWPRLGYFTSLLAHPKCAPSRVVLCCVVGLSLSLPFPFHFHFRLHRLNHNPIVLPSFLPSFPHGVFESSREWRGTSQ